MNLPANPGVKVLQHGKAMGNARAQSRGAMFPIFYNAGDPLGTGTITPYGPENSPLSVALFNSVTGEGIIAAGRLESVKADSALKDVRIAHKEAYRLYWLPAVYVGTGLNDWQIGNPPKLEDNLSGVAGVKVLQPGMTIFMSTQASSDNPPNIYGSVGNYDGMELTAFKILDAPVNVLGDLLEYEALVVRDETQGLLRAVSV